MARSLPPLNALRAFEAAARNGSFTRAADELCVTQGAVSQQVKALELDLAAKLFHRAPGGLELTESGRDYLSVVRDALDRIALGTERLRQRQGSGMLTVSVSPDFAAKFLVHRLGRFSDAHPEITLRISADMHHVDFAREDVDVAVRHGEGNWPGLDAVGLASEQLLAVCSPALADKDGGLRAPADLLRLPLLHLDAREAWGEWQALPMQTCLTGR
jgi:LysR family transcriptional regulator, glycine cleavage system transcriptional activator